MITVSLIVIFIIFITLIILLIYYNFKLKRINENRSNNEELLYSLWANVNDIFVIYDIVNNEFEYVSPNFERILGLSLLDLYKNPYTLLEYAPADKRAQIKYMFSSLQLNSLIEFESEYTHPITKQKYWFILRLYPVSKDNTVIRYISHISDITKEHQAQVDIQEVLSNLQKANEAKKDFLSHMSHELKTPINAIIGMTQIAHKSSHDADKVSSCLDKINYASKNLLILINDILNTAKVDSDKLLLNNQPFSLPNVISYFSSLVKTQADLNHQDYRLIYHDIRDEYLIGDSLRLIQILSNCTSNSLKFTPLGGKITLEIIELNFYESKALYRFIISDTGKGMREDYLDRLFQPFDQEDSTIAIKYGGSGLGMSITKNLIILMGGTIRISSEIDSGTVVTIDLAFQLDQDKNSAANTLPMENTLDKDYDFTGMRVLVVEDNEINLEITCEFLKYLKVEVECVSNGYEAIKLFETSTQGYYQAILMDVQMPGLSGFDTTKIIRNSKHPDATKIVIIAVTADNFADSQLSKTYGMDYHITKPIDMDKFNQIIQTIYLQAET